MNIGITYDLKSDWLKQPRDPADINAEFDKPETIDRIVTALESGGHQVTRIGNVYQLLECIDELNVDIVFNVCEGKEGRNRESQVPILLELKNIPYVGSDALTLGMTLDKMVAKQMFISQKIPTARYFQAANHDDIDQLNTIGFPLIVKTCYEGSSKGIQEASRVENNDALIARVKYITENYRQPAFVEDFISGTEFTVAVMGNENPLAMPVVQVSIDGDVQLNERFYTNDRIYSNSLQYICPAKISGHVAKKIQQLAVKAYTALGCRDFGRVDFRVDNSGQPYVLEINPIPSFDAEDVFNIFPQLFGLDFKKIVNLILDLALIRYGLLDLQEDEITRLFHQEAVT